MAFTLRTQLFVTVLFSLLLSQVIGHSYMTKPISRSNQAETQTGCRGPSCNGPCDVPLSRANRAPIVAARGSRIVVEWPRNNHAGGFIRFAWAPTDLSDNHAAFDAHVQLITCHEIGNPTAGQCAPADPVNDPNGGGSGPGDGSSGACNTGITVPSDLTDGKWTLQWAWFGGAFALGDYYSCADYVIAGGPSGQMIPAFRGGDYSYPNQPKCKFFNTDKLHVCTEEPCQNPIYPAGQRSGPPAAGQLGVVNVTLPSVPGSVPSTPAIQQVSTTGVKVVVPPVVSVPPVVPVPVVPAPVVPKPPVVQVPVPSTPSVTVPINNNCIGSAVASVSTAKFTAIDVWSTGFHATVEIDVEDSTLSNWLLEVSWPSSVTSPHIVSSFNGGALQCEAPRVAYFKPAAQWSNNMPRGSMIQVEFVASSSGLSATQITSSTRLRVLKN